MEYHIRYRESEESGELTVMVEANSPTEALVKFRHTRSPGKAPTAASVTEDDDSNNAADNCDRPHDNW